jgi:signal recognition particle subunit SRP54
MINSMTTAERADPDLLAKSPGRRRRVARGSGHSETDVTKLISNFTRMRSMMQQMGRGQMPAMPGMPGMGDMGGMFGGGGRPAPGFRGYPGGASGAKKAKKPKKKKGFGEL